MQTQGVLNNGKQIEYGLGLEISTYRGLPIVEHGGALFGYRTELLRFPQQKFSVITLCNLGTSSPGNLANQVADIYLDGQFAVEPAIAAAAHVDPQPFAGWYRNLGSHSVVEISTFEGDVVAFGQHFKPLAPARFALRSGAELNFESRGGSAMRMTLTTKDSTPQIFDRYDPLKRSEEDFAPYIGEYSSTELQATYRFAVKDDKLTLSSNWQEPAVLEPTIRDEFQGPLGTAIVFRRDPSGHVTGCDLFAGRVRNISFAKVIGTAVK